ncbi:MAG: hypothetical protein MSH40_01240 [Christensenella sp.]|nr:hypothetical protein [Christensenella sp.]
MYESLMERENQATRVSQYSNDRYVVNNNGYYDTYGNNRPYYSNNQPIQNVTPYRAAPVHQNYYYTKPQSDNINTAVPPQQLSSMVQNTANMFQQAPVYQPTYEDYQQYNNVRVNAQSYPTNMYYQQPVNNVLGNQRIENQNIKEIQEYEKVAPATKGKIKNKMTKALIAVYFMIIAICAALILINLIAGATGSEAVASSVSGEVISSEINYIVNEDGSVDSLTTTPKVIEYEYDTSTNWFDRLCDAIGKSLG